MERLLALATYLLAAAAVSTLVWGLFRRIDKVAGEGPRIDLARWLAGQRHAPGEQATDWAKCLSELFDALFGAQLHSRRAVLWSCALSFGSMAFLLGLFVVLDLPSVRMVSRFDLSAGDALPTLIAGAGFVAMMNFVPDYVSLIETRWVVRRIATCRSAAGRAGWLAIDAALTFFTLFAFMFLFTFLGWSLDGGIVQALREYPSFVDDFWWAIGPSSEHPVQLCFYSTFTTSLLVWLYGLGSFAIRNLAHRSPGHPWLRGLFCGGEPVRAVGATAALIAFVSVLVLCFVVAPGEHWLAL